MTQKTQQLLTRYKNAYNKSLKFQSMYRSAYELTMPERDLFNENIQNTREVKVYDSTGISAVKGFVNSLTSTLTPPFSRWIELEAGPSVQDETQKETINTSMDVINEQIEALLNASNFYQCIGEFYQDLAIGQSCLLCLESDDRTKPIEFQCIPQSQIVIEEGKFGAVGAVFRKFKIAVNLIQQTWPGAKLTQELETLKNSTPDAEVELIECTYLDYESKDDRKWNYEVLYTNSEASILQQKFYDNPFIVCRWSKIAGESIGRGPVLDALPDLKMLNKERELSIRNNMLQSYGCYTYTDTGVLNPNNITLEPGSFIPVERNAGASGPSIQALPLTGNPSIAENDMLRLQMSIKNMLYDNRLPQDGTGVVSATEINARLRFLQSDIGSAFGRIMTEFVNPLIRRIVGIMIRKEIIKLPELSAGFNEKGVEQFVVITEKNIDNLLLKINVLSPIARVQNMEEVQQAITGLQAMIATDPSGGQITMAVVDVENLFKWIADKSGIPAKFTRNEEERAQYKDMLKQQQDQVQNEQIQKEVVMRQIGAVNG